MAIVSASAARQTLPAQLDLVEAGEEVAITRHGRVVAMLVSPNVLKWRRAPETMRRADEIREMLKRARSAELPPAAISPERAEELVGAVREDRDTR